MMAFPALLAALAIMQESPLPAAAPAQDTGRSEAVRVFLDCNQCDQDYIRTEVTFVNWVRDRRDAEVILLVTSLPTGSGGREFTFTYFGRERFQGRNDTLTVAWGATDTPVERRAAMVRVMRYGLVRYALNTPLAQHLEVRYAPPQTAAVQRERRDPWHHWVFTINANGNVSAQSATKFWGVFANLGINHVSELWKHSISFNGSFSKSEFEIDSVTTFTATRESYGVSASSVRSINGRWSAGVITSANRNTFTNLDMRLRATPALEFDVFPYAQSTRRQLVFRYAAGVELSNYEEVTLYGRTAETRPVHSLSVSYSVRQPWGQIFASGGFNQYLHDTSKRSFSISGGPSLRIFRGLNLNLSGSYAYVRDQIYLAASAMTPEQIIARQRALATDYSLFFNFGLQYRFGSIYSNVVNPRFPGSGGFFIEF